MTIDRFSTAFDSLGTPAVAGQYLARQLGAVCGVHAATRGTRVEADVVQNGGDGEHLAVYLPAATAGELRGYVLGTQAMPLHRPVGAISGRTQPLERITLGRRDRQLVEALHGLIIANPRSAIPQKQRSQTGPMQAVLFQAESTRLQKGAA